MKINSIVKSVLDNRNILVLLALGLIFRFYLSIFPAHVDILSIAGWGRWIFQNGPMGFYEHNVWYYSWPTQPPAVNLLYTLGYFLHQQLSWFFTQTGSFIAFNHLGAGHILWYFDFVKWFGEATYLDTDFPIGFILSLKFFGILADILIALVIYFMARRFSKKQAVIFSAIYLFSPFTFYLSALWGQYDQVGYLFLLLSLISLLNRKTLIIAPVFLALSINLKPTSLIFIPLFLWIYFRQRPSFSIILLGLVTSVIILVISIIPFTRENPIYYLNSEIIPRVFYKAEFRVSTNSFNFWHILIGNKALGQNEPFLFIPARIWGYLFFIFLNVLAFKVSKTINAKNLFTAMFIIGVGGWLFLTNMLERYFFAGIVSGLFLALYYPKILRYWIILSLIFWINLYHGWWYPDVFEPLMDVLRWQEGFLTRILALVNVLLFLKILNTLQIFPESLKKFKIKLS